MRLINRIDIENWARSFDAKGRLPVLVSKLVRSTTPTSTRMDFPAESSAFVGGWDGIVDSQEAYGNVPAGISLWEFGTEPKVKKKADGDYSKRSLDALSYNPKECTLVLLTPRFWREKDKWRNERLKEGVWKDVRVLDSRSIEEWLDSSPAVARWFAAYLGKSPFDGIQIASRYWEEWSASPKGEMPPECITAGREQERRALLEFLTSEPGIRGVQASTQDEAIAFIIAAAKQLPQQEQDYFFSKTLVVDTEANFRGIQDSVTTFMNLIPRFQEAQPFQKAVDRGHHVIIPMGPDANFNQQTIALPTIDRDGQVAGLLKIGLSLEEAEKYSLEAGRNITILKRLLHFPDFKAKWLVNNNIKELVPAVLLGRWNEKHEGDKKLLEILSGLSYDECAEKLSQWCEVEEPPLLRIGEAWRVTSPLDAWDQLARFISSSDFERLEKAFYIAFSKGNPTLEKPGQAELSRFISPERTFSSWAREGLAQSLILISLYGEKLKLKIRGSHQDWVDRLVRSILYEADEELWLSTAYELPLLAEASPESFVEAVNASLSSERKAIMSLFVERESLLFSRSEHSGLLWALEGLAWLPEYLRDASYLLAKLAALDPGGTLANRPMSSLTNIFKSWHFQTLASLDERMEVASDIAANEKEIGWKLLRSFLPEHHDYAEPTHRFRWRLFEKGTRLSYTYEEVFQTHNIAIQSLLSTFDYTEERFTDLIKDSVDLAPANRARILNFLNEVHRNVQHAENKGWHAIRKILSQHRSHPDTNWALPEQELRQYAELYQLLEPDDLLQKYVWLFNESWPDFAEGPAELADDKAVESYDAKQLLINERRLEAATLLMSELGIGKIRDLSLTVQEPGALGDTVALIIQDDESVLYLAEMLNSDEKGLPFFQAFVFRSFFIQGLKWVKDLYKNLARMGFDEKALAQLFIPVTPSKALWEFIDCTTEAIKKQYWTSLRYHFYHVSPEEKVIGLEHLLKYGRYLTAIDVCFRSLTDIPTELIIRVLRIAATRKAMEESRIGSFEIERIFEHLEKQSEVDVQTLVELEWLYIPFLASYGSRRSPKLLHEEMARNPQSFIDVLKCLYRPKSDDLANAELKSQGLSNEEVIARAQQVRRLLETWKSVPGMDSDGRINKRELNEWIDNARSLAHELDRLEVADIKIAQLLAQYPEKDFPWPPDEICEVIERISSDSFRRSFSSATFNKRGSSTRAPFDGGAIERKHAEYFNKLAAHHKRKYPTVASIFTRLAKNYLEDARRMDEEAERERLDY